MCRKIVLCCALFTALGASAASDEPDVSGWSGTGYRSSWFSYETDSAEGGVKLSTLSEFLLSPHYSASVRKVILKVSCNSVSPTRVLCVKPMVGGSESADESLWRTVSSVGSKDTAEYVHLNWDAALGVDALRICLAGSGSAGIWTVSGIHVFYGEKAADEDETVRELVKELPAPAGLEFSAFTGTSLSLRAEEVDSAAGYRFEVYRLVGEPFTEVREDFTNAPDVSDGWTMTSENAKLEASSSTSHYDSGARDKSALKIGCASTTAEDVRVEIVSPVLPAPANSYSFMYKVGSVGKSTVFKVFGCDGEGGGWSELANIVPQSTSKSTAQYRLQNSDNVRQFKFVFEAKSDDYTVSAFDSLCIACGGDEERIPAGTSETLAKPEYALSDLETARYCARVMAIADAGSEYGDSQWSEEVTADLNWAKLVAGEPSGVKCEAADGRLLVSWNAAANAGYYLVDVSTTGVPSEKVVDGARTTDTFIEVEVPELGEYSVTVTAYSPGGMTSAPAAPVVTALELGKLGKVTATALDRESLEVKWSAIPFAEGYRVRVLQLGGETAVFTSDYSGLPDVWPEGWTHHEYIDKVYSGNAPKIDWRDTWIATCAYPLPVTEIVFSVKSHAAEAGITEKTSVAVDVSSAEDGDVWTENFAGCAVSSAKQNVSVRIACALGIKRVRFRFLLDDDDLRKNPLVEFGAVTVHCGEETKTEVASLRTDKPGATVGSLPRDGTFAVEVTPLPSEGDELSSLSERVDLSLMKPREISPVCVSDFAGGSYFQNFDALAAVTKETSAKELGLNEWQLHKGDDPADTLKFTSTGKATAGGVYAIVSGADAAARALATLATSSFGCSFGIAFTNDLQTAVESPKLSFTAVQRSFKSAPKTYALEYLVTGGAFGIGTGGEWKSVEIPVTAPLTSETCGETAECRQPIGPLEFPAEIPPGGALILRWRDVKGASSPMMGVDDVRFECTARPRSLTLILR